MTAGFDEDTLRHWLVDYLVTTIGCSPEEVDVDAPLSDLSVSSSDAVVLSGELSELLGRSISPVEFWQYPTINALAQFLTGSQPEWAPEAVVADDSADGVDEPIAVIGVGCRFPGDIGGPEGLWRFLSEGASAVTQVPQGRWSGFDEGSSEAAAALAATTRWGSFLREVDAFDADFFEISPREAVKMDPQQRLLLEVAHEAMEHAGIAPAALRRTETGVFVGACQGEYGYLASADLSQVDAWSGTGGALSIIANRVSYVFDLRGPSVTVDTACSSSLVAVHLACQSLRTGDSSMALAGGVNVLLSPVVTRSFDQAEAMSPTGRCHAFDAAADGFVRGEGAGVVVLKRLTDARRDGDRVLAVVRGSAVNQDGRSNGLMAPNPSAQMAVLRAAYAHAGVKPGEVDYVEAHGTGTLLGDPIEARALGTVLGRGRRPDAPLLIGSVKSNLGHLEAAAGVAGFIKAVLAVQRGVIPANLHFDNPNPHIPFDDLRLKVIAEPTDWPGVSRARRAGVSSFGFGGTNAHVVVEQAPDPAPSVVAPPPVVSTVVVSGKSEERIAATAGVLADWMQGEGAGVGLADVAHTLNHHRTRHPLFATVCARDRVQAVTGLRALAAGYAAPGVVGPHQGRCRPGVVFVYSGQGSQWAGMGRQLLADEPAFAAAVAELEPVFVEQVGFSLQQVLAGGEPVSGIAAIQPVLVGMQLALTALWRSYGVTPAAVIGHSMGEVSAAVVAGALTPAQGLAVIATRSRLMSRLSGQGAMALLELDPDSTEALIADYAGVTLAVYASPRQTVIAGAPEQVDAVIAVVDAQNRLARRIEVDVASHHPTIDPILPQLRAALADLSPAAPRIPLISTTDPTPGAALSFDADYWVANLRNPVRFSHALSTAATEHATFIEISPHPLLTHAITDTLAAIGSRDDVQVEPTMTRDGHETLTFHTQLATIEPPLDGMARRASAGGHLADLPPTPWQHGRYWVENRSASPQFTGTHPLLGAHVELPSGRGHVWQADIGTEINPWLADHRVHGQAVMPAAGFAEIALAAASEALGMPAADMVVSRLEVEQMLVLQDRTRTTTQLAPTDDNGFCVEVFSRSAGDNWSRHAVARVEVARRPPLTQRSGPAIEAGTELSTADFYAAMRRTGAHHGQAFAALNRIVSMPDGAVECDIILPEEATAHRGFRIHPVMFDAALQALAAAMPAELIAEATEVTYLPVSIETFRVFAHVGRRARCHAEMVGVDDDGAGTLGRITLFDDAGHATAEIAGVYLRRVQRRTVPLPLEQKLFDTSWEHHPLAEGTGSTPAPTAGSWLVLADDDMSAVAQGFTEDFGSPTRRLTTADLADESAVLEAFAKAAADPDFPPQGVVVFVTQQPSFDGTISDGTALQAQEAVWRTLAAARAIVGGWHGKSPRLWLVTRDGLTVHGDESGDPAVGALKGLIRVLAYEHPDLHATLVDLDSAGPPCSGKSSFVALTTELEASGSDDVVAWRGEHRYVERLSRAALDTNNTESVVRRHGSYVVTGGLGGLGMVVVRWLADNGAGRVVVNGRSDLSAEQREILAGLEDRAEVAFVRGDIASPGVAERLVTAAEETGRPLRGVIHSAAVIDDALVTALDKDSLARVWNPKAVGALRLHEATATRELDWWVAFSSVASLLGSPGQAAYACANAYVDGLVGWRRAAGLPATAINWGQWSDVGVARSLALGVLDPISPDEGLEALESLLGGGVHRAGVARLRLDRASAAFPEIRQLGYFARLVEELETTDDDDDWPGPTALAEMDAAEASRIVAARLRGRILAIMGYPAHWAIEASRPLIELGMDSLMAVRIRNTARGDFGVEPPVALLLQGASLQDLTAELIRQLGLTENIEGDNRGSGLRDRAHQRAAARQFAAARRKTGQRV